MNKINYIYIYNLITKKLQQERQNIRTAERKEKREKRRPGIYAGKRKRKRRRNTVIR